MTWDDFFMGLAQYVAQKSKDRSRKIGAVAVDQRNVVLSLGWNGFPRGVNDDVEERHARPKKYFWVVHAEGNLVANASSKGVSLLGAKMYVNWYPCCDCAKIIVQAGFSEVVCLEPDWDDANWAEHFKIARELFAEAGVKVRFVGKFKQKPT
jgi:dCMP deaminase